MRQSLGAHKNEQILKDISSLSLEKYVEELAGAAMEGIGRCKTERDVWSAVEVHQHTMLQLIADLGFRLSPPCINASRKRLLLYWYLF